MLQLHWHLYLISGFLGQLSGVLSALYPTRPIASTVFVSGQAELLEWTDDGRYPLTQDLGTLSIKLYTSQDDYVSSLAEGVSPTSYGTSVTIPHDLKNDTLYMVRFSCPELSEDVYTADFAITPAAYTRSPSSSVNNTLQTLALSKTTAAATSSAASKIVQAPVSTPTEPLDKYVSGSFGVHHNTAHGRIDLLEKAKFRLMFIVWPALVGISMAL